MTKQTNEGAPGRSSPILGSGFEGKAVDPLVLFREWYQHAKMSGLRRKVLGKLYPPIVLHQPDAMVLSTLGVDGYPSSRLVLLKEVSQGGFVFYTNHLSRKAKEMAANPKVSLVFQWSQPDRQVRVEGEVSQVSVEESDLYWSTRPRGSQLASMASVQSAEIASREVLEAEVKRLELKWKSMETIPRPSHWGGYRVLPRRVEFWEARVFRLHDRLEFIRERDPQSGSSWRVRTLSP